MFGDDGVLQMTAESRMLSRRLGPAKGRVSPPCLPQTDVRDERYGGGVGDGLGRHLSCLSA